MRPTLIALFLLSMFTGFAQQEIRIALIHDAKGEEGILKQMEQATKTEITQILQHRYQLRFEDFYGNSARDNLQSILQQAYAENDIVITLGVLGSQAAFTQSNFPKPTIAAITSDARLSNLNQTPEGTSGTPNLVYIESPFDIRRDLQTLRNVRPFQRLAVVYDPILTRKASQFLEVIIKNNLDDDSIQLDFYSINELSSGTADFEEGTDALYVMPILNNNASTQIPQLFDKAAAKGLPSAALFGSNYIENGALIAYKSDHNLALIPRRIALNTMKIVEGIKASDIPVAIETYSDDLLINVATARRIGIFPNFDMFAQATLINIENEPAERQLSLKSAIAEALRSNLDYQLSNLDIQVADRDVGIAQADQLPQVDVSTSYSMVDDLTALSYQGAQGQYNWIGSAQLSQVIFSEPLLANIAIQKMLKAGEEYELQQNQLDLIIDVAEAYLNILQAKSNLQIQQKNVEVTKENYNISKSKNVIGYAGAADLYRWEAELALKNIDLNAALAALQQAKYRLNQLLNRPIGEPFSVQNETLEEKMLLVTDGRLEMIDDYGDLTKFTAFIIDFANNRLPTLDIVDNNIKLQERQLLSRQRAFYLPALSLNGGANRLLSKSGVPEIFTPVDNATTWNLNFGASYPIFQGFARKKELEKSEIQLQQLQLTRQNVRNQLELAIRSNMETIYVSYTRMDLSRVAADASDKNFDVIQDAYNQGQVNITALIDAQNNNLQSELSAINAVYEFILDFLTLERSIGFFYFLASEEDKNQFFQQVNDYLFRQ
ncbi:MAG: TolC family protein [Bacteroidota bacterium]